MEQPVDEIAELPGRMALAAIRFDGDNEGFAEDAHTLFRCASPGYDEYIATRLLGAIEDPR